MERSIADNLFNVYHSYDIKDHEEARFIGVFNSKKKAEEIVKKYKLLPGFKDFPDEFTIDKIKINEKTNCSITGFVTKDGFDLPCWYVESEYYKQNFLNEANLKNKNNKVK